jgi:2,3-bisphosphoglycerate-independent phosphoglycerate mutase
MGNSEVGHMNLGAGRVVMQDLPLIDEAIANNTLKDNTTLNNLIKNLKKSGGDCHLIGLVSPGGVHSHQDHLIALAKILNSENISSKLHAFMDGRDTAQSGGKNFIVEVLNKTATLSNFSIATITGRYWGRDRDNNWDRIIKAYNAISTGLGMHANDPIAAIQGSYDVNTTDEFMLPHCIDNYTGMKDGDAILMFNFRSDRAREIISCFVDPDFNNFKKERHINLSAVAGMSEYSAHLSQFMGVLFPQRKLTNVLGKVISDAGLKQLRIAETEKYAHVTFFFNGGDEKIYKGEERILVPSPKVATYDLKPEMAAHEVTNKLIEVIKAKKFDVIIVNYANGDMVGHTGILDAAIKAAETIDQCLGRLEEALIDINGVMLVTADHGNLEQMNIKHTQEPHTAHTLSPVPLVLVNPPSYVRSLRTGVLSDVSPTLLRLLGINQPDQMSGHSLIIETKASNEKI